MLARGHEFTFHFFCGRGIDTRKPDLHAKILYQPSLLADLTRGLPPH